MNPPIEPGWYWFKKKTGKVLIDYFDKMELEPHFFSKLNIVKISAPIICPFIEDHE